MIKLICSDIDGTLLNAKRELSEKTITEIGKLKDKLPILLISARMPSAMKHLQVELGIEHMPIVAYNGGLILVGGKVLQSTTIPYELVKQVVELNTKGLHLSLYHNDDWFVPQRDKWAERETNNTKVNPTVESNLKVLENWENGKTGAHKIICMGDANLIQEFYDVLSDKMPNELHLYRSKDTYIEIAPKQISKRSAIEFLISTEYDFDMTEIMSFGDNYNDVEMIKACGLGLAVQNARDEVKKVASKVIGHSKEDGVAKFLNAYFNLR